MVRRFSELWGLIHNGPIEFDTAFQTLHASPANAPVAVFDEEYTRSGLSTPRFEDDLVAFHFH